MDMLQHQNITLNDTQKIILNEQVNFIKTALNALGFKNLTVSDKGIIENAFLEVFSKSNTNLNIKLQRIKKNQLMINGLIAKYQNFNQNYAIRNGLFLVI